MEAEVCPHHVHIPVEFPSKMSVHVLWDFRKVKAA